jgi:hypothetical protein
MNVILNLIFISKWGTCSKNNWNRQQQALLKTENKLNERSPKIRKKIAS